MFSAHTLAKRGLEVAHGLSQQQDGNAKPQINPISGLIFLLTLAAFFLLLGAMSYTYGHLIPILAMVESSSSTAYIPIQTVEPVDDDAPPAYTEDGVPKPIPPEANLIRTRPVTTSIRATILHLRAKAGFWSRFRGLSVYLIWNFARSVFVGILSAVSDSPFAVIFAAILAEIALVSYPVLLETLSYSEILC